MIIINHHYSLTPEWQNEVIQQTNARHINNEITIVPEKLGDGTIYFTQVLPALSVHLLDMVFTTGITINRYPSHQNLYVLQYDISNKHNKLIIDNITHDIGNKGDIQLTVIDSQFPNTFIPVVNERTFGLRLTVDKDFLNLHLKNEDIFKAIEKNHSFNSFIDSETKILIYSLRNKSVFDISYSSFLKGITLKVFANFINTHKNKTQINNEIIKSDIEAINKTTNYLAENLYGPFPSILLLSKMAGMSPTKYKLTFTKIHNTSPNKYFIKEKMIFSNKLLTSKDFTSLTEIAQLLNYSKVCYFTFQYFKVFQHKPCEDFKKKEIKNSP
ncbi:AraC-like DNA-binding protein [Flavobacterium sp. 9]|uniref:helix-turn-helix domain-containing protein n=1 Tax=Flavobacterium sp. 9 TaxID=2035198 RepID=UPI000C1954D1|nr:AraC family transcriptional regulator [Flavobacterium sp. 9]PIF30173.1 AraC-like DNA-binding protein [Flavobacterium sp. 9]